MHIMTIISYSSTCVTAWFRGIKVLIPLLNSCVVPPLREREPSRFVNSHGWKESQNSEGPYKYEVSLVNYTLWWKSVCKSLTYYISKWVLDKDVRWKNREKERDEWKRERERERERKNNRKDGGGTFCRLLSLAIFLLFLCELVMQSPFFQTFLDMS